MSSKYNEKYKNNWACYCPDSIRERYQDEDLMIDMLYAYGGCRKHGGENPYSEIEILFEEIFRLRKGLKDLLERSY